MALINCPECKSRISDKAIACPQCGFPLAEYNSNNKKTIENTEKVSDRTDNIEISKKSQGNNSKIVPGEIIRFGRYKQLMNTDQVQELEWIVLEKSDNRILVVSKYAIDNIKATRKKAFTIRDKTVYSWKGTSLRKWLNEYFYNVAFNDSEKRNICTSQLKDFCSTNDNVFLLSAKEIEEYVSYLDNKACSATEYAHSKGAFLSKTFSTTDGNPQCYWWTRELHVMAPTSDIPLIQYLYSRGDLQSLLGIAVRPALWMTI